MINLVEAWEKYVKKFFRGDGKSIKPINFLREQQAELDREISNAEEKGYWQGCNHADGHYKKYMLRPDYSDAYCRISNAIIAVTHGLKDEHDAITEALDALNIKPSESKQPDKGEGKEGE